MNRVELRRVEMGVCKINHRGFKNDGRNEIIVFIAI